MDYQTYFTQNTTSQISRDLIGRPLIFDNGSEKLGGYIVETEAYLGPKDRAAHSYNGYRSQANEGLYRMGGSLYIYSRRQYFFLDVACQKENVPEGVLIRAFEPVWGIKTMQNNRHGKTGPLLTNGPGKLMQALGITSRKWDLVPLEDSPFEIDLNDQHKKIAKKILATPRIGINQTDPEWAKKPLRFIVSGNPFVSQTRKSSWQEANGWQKNPKNN